MIRSGCSALALLALLATGCGADDQRTLTGDATLLHDEAPPWRGDLLQLHRSLVEIRSISGEENEVGDFIVQYLTSRDYLVQIQFLPPRPDGPKDANRFNVVAWAGQSYNPNPRVLVTSHIDVVPPHIPYSISDEMPTGSSVITGRGSVDAKGSVATQIIALENLRKAGKVQAEEVMLLFVVGEEDRGDGMRNFSAVLNEMYPPPKFEAVIFGEPTENKLACGHKGGLFCSLDAKGIAGHSGYPELGKSANELMIRALSRILDTDLGSSERFGHTTVNIGRLEGGVAANVIPDHSHADLSVRVAIGPEKGGAEIVKGRIEAELAAVDADAFTLACTHGYGFVECTCGVEGFEDTVEKYGTDIPNLQGDFARYLYGPGTILVAHGDHENLTVSDLETAVTGYEKLILHALESNSR